MHAVRGNAHLPRVNMHLTRGNMTLTKVNMHPVKGKGASGVGKSANGKRQETKNPLTLVGKSCAKRRVRGFSSSKKYKSVYSSAGPMASNGQTCAQTVQ